MKVTRDLVPVGETRNVPLLSLPMDKVEEYWQALYMHDTLRFRFCDTVDPTWSDVLECIVRMGKYMFHIVDEDNNILVDYAFDNRSGDSAQIHFSTHPRLVAKYVVPVCKKSTDESLVELNLQSIYGLTPVTNRAACIMVQRMGFKKIGILPGGTTDLVHSDTAVDAMITVKVPKEN